MFSQLYGDRILVPFNEIADLTNLTGPHVIFGGDRPSVATGHTLLTIFSQNPNLLHR